MKCETDHEMKGEGKSKETKSVKEREGETFDHLTGTTSSSDELRGSSTRLVVGMFWLSIQR